MGGTQHSGFTDILKSSWIYLASSINSQPYCLMVSWKICTGPLQVPWLPHNMHAKFHCNSQVEEQICSF